MILECSAGKSLFEFFFDDSPSRGFGFDSIKSQAKKPGMTGREFSCAAPQSVQDIIGL
jgi:hypothetical protein